MIAKQIKAIEKDVSKMLDKIIGSSNTTVIAAFEKLIEELESHQVGLMEKADQSGKPKKIIAEIIEPPLRFPSSRWNLY